MALQSSGPISMGDIRTELGLSGSLGLGDSITRILLNRLSGAVNLSDAYGKSASPTVPGTPFFSGVSTSGFVTSWAAATTNTAGSISYDVYVNGSYYTNTASTSVSVSGLASNTYYTVQILAKLSLSYLTFTAWGGSSGTTTYAQTPSISLYSTSSNGFTLSLSGSVYYQVEITELWDVSNLWVSGPYISGTVIWSNQPENTGFRARARACDANGNALTGWSGYLDFNTAEADIYWTGVQVTVGYWYYIYLGRAADIDSFWFTATATTHTITLDASYSSSFSGAFDPYLTMLNSSQVVIFTNDDGNGGRNSKIVATGLTVGNWYVIRCSSYGSTTWGTGILTLI